MLIRRFSKLFQKGPVQTSLGVRESILVDYGSRDPNFGKQVEDIKSRILRFAKVDPLQYSCVFMQGPASYICDGLFSTLQQSDKILIGNNGTIGKEMTEMAKILKKPFREMISAHKFTAAEFIANLDSDTSHVAVVHEESSGLLNPINEICQGVKAKNKEIHTIVNGSQGYDWINLDFSSISFYFGAFHNVIQAFSGVSFCIANNEALAGTKGKYLSLALDIEDQCQYQIKNPGQFRFTPPTHLIAAAYAGINEWELEGINGRLLRVKKNNEFLINCLSQLGFSLVYPKEDIGYSCVSVYTPKHPNWDSARFSASLQRRNMIVNPEHMDNNKEALQIGVTGDLFLGDVKELMEAFVEVFQEMRIPVPIKA